MKNEVKRLDGRLPEVRAPFRRMGPLREGACSRLLERVGKVPVQRQVCVREPATKERVEMIGQERMVVSEVVEPGKYESSTELADTPGFSRLKEECRSSDLIQIIVENAGSRGHGYLDCLISRICKAMDEGSRRAASILSMIVAGEGIFDKQARVAALEGLASGSDGPHAQEALAELGIGEKEIEEASRPF